jgi:DNA-binding winged helix-turn-helix (wHTH) protein
LTFLGGLVETNTELIPGVGDKRESLEPQKRYIRFGDFWIDTKHRILRRHNKLLPLADKPYDILLFLIHKGGTLATRKELFPRFWPDIAGNKRYPNLYMAVMQIRKCLGNAAFIESIKSQGYYFNGNITYTDSFDLPIATPAPASGSSLSRSFDCVTYSDLNELPISTPERASGSSVSRSFGRSQPGAVEVALLWAGPLLVGTLLGVVTSILWWIHRFPHGRPGG